MARAPVPPERRFYAQDRAVGRFGMRVFEPRLMDAPHWHGHVEGNLMEGASMTYLFGEEVIVVPEGRVALFWANVPHQLVRVDATGEAPLRLTNLYLPLDRFLLMPHLAALQVGVVSGGIALVPPEAVGAAEMARWFRDYRSGDVERVEVLHMELNAALRRALLGGVAWLRAPAATAGPGRPLGSPRMGQVVAMLRAVMENLDRPLANADVARVTGLNATYAQALFAEAMRTPLKRFIIRMRLLRARALLLDGGLAIATVAERSGFGSVSQFYDHFTRGFGTTPQAMRRAYEEGRPVA